MFQKSHLIFLLTATSLQAARIDYTGSTIREEANFVLDETGLVGALQQAKERFGQGARIVLPEEYLYVTQLKLDLPPEHSRQAIEENIMSVFPETLGNLAWDYELTESNAQGGTVELSGIVRDFGEVLEQSLVTAHYRIEALIPESYALARLVLGDETALVLHEKEAGWLAMLIAKERVVTSIFLTAIPTENDLKGLIAFGTERKQAVPQHVILSLIHTEPQALPQLDLPQVVLDTPLNPLVGAAKILLGSHDSERMDLPIRGNRSTWLSRFLMYFQ